MGFRCTAIVGNQNGLVGVGCMAGRDVSVAAKRALVDAKKHIIRVSTGSGGCLCMQGNGRVAGGTFTCGTTAPVYGILPGRKGGEK